MSYQKVADLKLKYDYLLTEKVCDYLKEKGLGNRIVEDVIKKSDSYGVLISLTKHTITLKDKDDIQINDNGAGRRAKDIKYGIQANMLQDALVSENEVDEIAQKRILYKIITQNYISQIIRIISLIRQKVGKKSQLVNQLSKLMLYITVEFYKESMALDTQDIHMQYRKILDSSNKYIALGELQMKSLKSSAEVLQRTSKKLVDKQVSKSEVKKLKVALDEVIKKLNETIDNIKKSLESSVIDNINDLKERFVLLSKYATPLQYHLQSISTKDDAVEIYHKEMSRYIFQETVDIFTSKLLKTYELDYLANDADWVKVLMSELCKRLEYKQGDLTGQINFDQITTEFKENSEQDDDFKDLESNRDSIEAFFDTYEGIENTNKIITNKSSYVSSLIKYMQNVDNTNLDIYDPNKIEEEFFSQCNKDESDFYNKILVFNLISFIKNVSKSLLETYGKGFMQGGIDNTKILQQIKVSANFSQDIIVTMGESMSKKEVEEYYLALIEEIKNYDNHKTSILDNITKYKKLPNSISEVSGVLIELGTQMGTSAELINSLNDNVKSIEKAVDKQFAIIKNKADQLSDTLSSVQQHVKAVKSIETAKIERLRTYAPNLTDAETKAQYYVLNALMETQFEGAKGIRRGINAHRKRALNFVQMTAVMNFIMTQGLMVKRSFKLSYYNESKNTREQINTQFDKSLLEDKKKYDYVFTDDNKSIVNDCVGMIQFCFIEAVEKFVKEKKPFFTSLSKVKLKFDDESEVSLREVFCKDKSSEYISYIDFMFAFYYLQVLFPFLNDEMTKDYTIILSSMERVFIIWIENIHKKLIDREYFAEMDAAYSEAMGQAMKDIDRSHLKDQQNLTTFQKGSRGVKRAVSWFGEKFIKNSDIASVGKTFKNYSVRPDSMDEFYKLFSTKYRERIGNRVSVNLPMALLMATDLSIHSIKSKEVDVMKTIFAGALTGGVASLIGISKFKSVLAGLTASSVYGLATWTSNSLDNYLKCEPQRLEHYKQGLDGMRANQEKSSLE